MPADGITLTALWKSNTTESTEAGSTQPGATESGKAGSDTAPSQEKIPKTGENAPYALVGIALLLTGAGLSILRRRGKAKKQTTK